MTLAFDLPTCPDSLVSRLDPRWKLAGVLLAALAIALVQTLPAALAALAGAVALVLLARLPGRWVTARVGIALLMLALLVVWRPWFPQPGDETAEVAGLT